MSFAIDGLVSGLDTTSLIASLMRVEAVPQDLLKAKVATTNTYVTALQQLNTRVAALADLATAGSKASALDLFSTTSSSAKITAVATTGATAGEVDIVVGALAQSQKSVSASMGAWPDSPPVITIVGADGRPVQVFASSSNLDDVVRAVNAAGVGVTATKIATGVGSYRIQFGTATAGAAGAFSVYRGSSDEVAAGTATNLFTEPGAATVRTAQDASLTLWAGTPAAQVITSATNTFADLLPGVSVTVGAVSADPVTISVARDTTAATGVAAALITALNESFSMITTRSMVSTSTNASGATTTTSGVFTGDGLVRDVKQKLLSAASLPIDGRSPSEMGITITKSGTIEFSAEKFAAALAKDPAGTQSAFRELSARIAAAATSASDRYDGQITAKITGQQSTVRELGNRISDWDLRLASTKAGLQRTYSALEVALSGMKAQSSWLSAQVAALPGAAA